MYGCDWGGQVGQIGVLETNVALLKDKLKELGTQMNVHLQLDVTVAKLKNLKASTKKFNEKIKLKMEVQRHIERFQLNKRFVEALHEQV